MSVQSGRAAPKKQQVHPAVIAMAVVALLAFILWRAYATFTIPQGKLPPPPTQDINFLKQKARECQGDFNKLSPEDQAKVQQVSHGWGVSVMQSDWRKISKGSQ